ncbi:helix-turn-helix domain-containing protein [Sulfitobacter mediterraneus]|uniref:helix-turn-helix domain-containing protein n=1 Tax=Sulfitobacter mediterraneus TaxID=83219 RepID=UPI00046ACE32|nr:helix-turn-helix transcriptional regulator [Sulfitobacter mediterraneus]KIN79619.1 putative transcriptional regulator [Sulfitobacter mediterraneus KCTC 32188]
MKVFAKRLKERALQLGISNSQAARLCDLDERRYSNYANDQREPDLMTLAKIARVLDTSVDHLLGLTDASPMNRRTLLLERLTIAAGTLPEDQLETVVKQTEALAIPRPKKPGRKSPPISGV